MKGGAAIAATLLAAVGVSTSVWHAGDCISGGAALAAPRKGNPRARAPEPTRQSDVIVTLPARPGSIGADSVTLSPNGRWLAVTADFRLHILDVKTRGWIRRLGSSYSSARWHPTKPKLIFPGGSNDKPDFRMANLATGKKRQLFRGDFYPFAWTRIGMVWTWGVVDLARSDVHGGATRNFGRKIPWNYGQTGLQHLSPSGPNDELAAEGRSAQKAHYGPVAPPQWTETYWMEMYRRVPGRRQWVRCGKVVPGPSDVWYPRDSSWLGDGRLVYLRIYANEWAPAHVNGSAPNPQFPTSKNRAELWVCNANGSCQRQITTLWDLRVYNQNPGADWITIDRQGRNVYYISGKDIRRMRVNIGR